MKKKFILTFTLTLLLTFNIALVYPADNEIKYIKILKTGSYQIKAHVQLLNDILEEQTILKPFIIFPENLSLKKIKSEKYNLYSSIITPNDYLILEWSKINYRNSPMKLINYKNYYFYSNIVNPYINIGTFFYIDQNRDKKVDKIIYSGDESLFLFLEEIEQNESVIESKLIFNLSNEKFIPKSFPLKLLHKTHLYKYKKWHFDTLNVYLKNDAEYNSSSANNIDLDNKRFTCLFNKGGSIVFQKDISNIDIYNYTTMGLRAKVEDNTITTSIRIIAKTKGPISKKVILVKKYNYNDGFYFLNLFDMINKKGLDINKIKLKEIIIDFTSSKRIEANIFLKELIFFKTKEFYSIPLEYFNENNKLGGNFNSITNTWALYNDDYEIINIKTILKNNSNKPQHVIMSNMRLTYIESKQIPKILTSSLINILDYEIINKLLNSNVYIKPIILYQVKNMEISINSKKILSYLNNFKPVYSKEINQFFKDQIIITSKLQSIIKNSEFYIKVSGSKNGEKFEDMYLIPPINSENNKQNINIIKFKILKEYSNIYISNIQIYMSLKNLPLITSNLTINIDEISIKKPKIVKLPNIVKDNNLFIILINDNRKIRIPITPSFTEDDLLYGGKWITIDNVELEKGLYKVKTTQSEYSTIDDLLFKIDNFIFSPENQIKSPSPVKTRSIKKYLLMIFILISAIFIILIIKKFNLFLKIICTLDKLMTFKTFFYLIQLILFILIIYTARKNYPSNNLTSSLILLLLFYSFWVRYVIRPILAKKWNYFKSNRSAPYFGLAIILLILTAIILAAGNNKVAEQIAIFVYFLLIEGVVIELKKFLSERIINSEL